MAAGLNVCWLCFSRTEASDVHGTLEKPRSADLAVTPSERAGGFSLASMMMFMTLVSVALGVSTIAPGVGIPLGIVLLGVWLRTAAVARHRAARGVATTRAERIQLFFTSFGATFAMIALTCAGGVGAFFAAVASVCAHDGNANQSTANVVMIFFGILAPVIAILTICWVVRVTSRRWRRDIGEVQSLDPLTLALAVLAGIVAVIAAIVAVWSWVAISNNW